MKPIPQIVRKRLQAGHAGSHPDANLLAAFAENALSRSERTNVLRHLADCPDCRQVLSVALPETQAATPVITPARAAWLRWPVLRWGAVAACVVVVGAAVTLRYQHRHAEYVVSNAPVNAVLVPAQPSAPAASRIEGFFKAEQKQSAPKPGDKVASVAASKKAPGRGDVAGRTFQTATAGNAPAQIATELAANALSKDAKNLKISPAPQETVEVTANEVATNGAKPAAADKLAEVAPGKAKEVTSSVAAPAATGGAVVGGVMMKQQVAVSRALRDTGRLDYAANLTPRWTLSADGTLQRSLDSGKTWQNIAVPGKATLRALATIGPEVWVGGTGGALYHSSDVGLHWTEVKLSDSGEALTADIIGVEFTDALHGKVTTADREIWTTTDAGKTWHKN